MSYLVHCSLKITKMETYKDFGTALQSFFYDYLVKERGVSKHTIRSYRDTFILLLDFMNKEKFITADRISLKDFNKDTILKFLDWLQVKRACGDNTRNQRYAALRSFSSYLNYIDPTHMDQWKSTCSIHIKRKVKSSVSYLLVEGIKCLLEQISTDTQQGRRNLTMLSLLYNTGARVQEIINLTPSNIRIDRPCIIELFGKGAKRRIVPIEQAMMELLDKYMTENNLKINGKDKHALFFNCWGGKLTTAGITYILNKYATLARIEYPDLIPEKVTPHIFRHSRAMHLLQAGVNLVYIRDILGHVSVKTTEVYARADSKAKRMALEKAYSDIGMSEPMVKSWEKDPKLKDFLKSLV